MSLVEMGAIALVSLFAVVACGKLLAAPLRAALRLLFNSALGFGALWLFQLTALPAPGLNLFNTLTVGVLGLPGLGLLFLLQWVLT